MRYRAISLETMASVTPSARRAIRALGSLAAFALGMAMLVRLTPIDGFNGVVLTTDTVPLRVAGRSPSVVVGYVDFGQTRLYATGRTVLALAASAALFAIGRRGAVPGAVLGVGGAGTLVALSGCGCGTGSATTLGALALEHATAY